MSEPFDEVVESAMIVGQDPRERLDELTRLTPVKEGSRCTNDPLQIALSQYAAQIAKTGRVFPQVERTADSPMDLHNLAAGEAQELMEGFSSLVKRGTPLDWAMLLELAFVRGFNESTMQRMRSNESV